MTARPLQFIAEINRVKQVGGAIAHFIFRESREAAHWNHDVFVRGEIFEPEVKLENKAE